MTGELVSTSQPDVTGGFADLSKETLRAPEQQERPGPIQTEQLVLVGAGLPASGFPPETRAGRDNERARSILEQAAAAEATLLEHYPDNTVQTIEDAKRSQGAIFLSDVVALQIPELPKTFTEVSPEDKAKTNGILEFVIESDTDKLQYELEQFNAQQKIFSRPQKPFFTGKPEDREAHNIALRAWNDQVEAWERDYKASKSEIQKIQSFVKRRPSFAEETDSYARIRMLEPEIFAKDRDLLREYTKTKLANIIKDQSPLRETLIIQTFANRVAERLDTHNDLLGATPEDILRETEGTLAHTDTIEQLRKIGETERSYIDGSHPDFNAVHRYIRQAWEHSKRTPGHKGASATFISHLEGMGLTPEDAGLIMNFGATRTWEEFSQRVGRKKYGGEHYQNKAPAPPFVRHLGSAMLSGVKMLSGKEMPNTVGPAKSSELDKNTRQAVTDIAKRIREARKREPQIAAQLQQEEAAILRPIAEQFIVAWAPEVTAADQQVTNATLDRLSKGEDIGYDPAENAREVAEDIQRGEIRVRADATALDRLAQKRAAIAQLGLMIGPIRRSADGTEFRSTVEAPTTETLHEMVAQATLNPSGFGPETIRQYESAGFFAAHPIANARKLFQFVETQAHNTGYIEITQHDPNRVSTVIQVAHILGYETGTMWSQIDPDTNETKITIPVTGARPGFFSF